MNATGRTTAANDAAAVEAYQEITKKIDESYESVASLLSRRSSEAEYRSAMDAFIDFFRSGRLFHSKSRMGYYISAASKQDAASALRTAIALTDTQPNLRQTNFGLAWAKAAAIAEMVSLDLINQTQPSENTLADVLTRWERQFSDMREAHQRALENQVRLEGRLEGLVNQFTQEYETSKANVSSVVAEYEGQIRAAILGGSAAIDAIKKTFKEDLSLQAPTTYWTAKRMSHQKLWIAWAISFLIAGGLSSGAVWFVWLTTAEPHFNPKEAFSYGFLLPAIGAAFLCVWIMRMMARQLLTNLALENDAAERVSMVMTFLALMQVPEHVHEPDRILILSALFRPSTHQSDDGAPPSWFDLVMQRIDNKAK